MIDVYLLCKRNKHSQRKNIIETTIHRNVAHSLARQLTIYGMSDAEFFVESKTIRNENKENET